jgi:hypothetical protein
MNSVSIVHGRISKKLQILLKIAQICQRSVQEIENLIDTYQLESMDLVIQYSCAKDEDSRKEIYENYDMFLSSNGFFQRHSEIIEKLFSSAPVEAAPFIHEYNQIGHMQDYVKSTSKICNECHVQYDIRSKSSDMCCPSCGIIIPLKGTYFESSESSRNGPYKPSKHCEQWVKRIFGIENTKIKPELITALLECMARDGVREPSYKLLRDNYFKELHMAKYNCNIVKIRRMLTGKGPPIPSATKYNNICRRFDIMDELYMIVKDPSQSSRRYYPTFIRKSIEDEYEDIPKVRDLILSGIHIQEQKTTESHDQLYEKMCEKSNGRLTFRKTKNKNYINIL